VVGIFQRDACFQTVFTFCHCQFFHILATWFLVFITAKCPMAEIKDKRFYDVNSPFHFLRNGVGRTNIEITEQVILIIPHK